MTGSTHEAQTDHFRGAFHAVPTHGLALLAHDGRIVAWNGAAAALTGYDAAVATERDLTWLLSRAEPPPPPARDVLDRARRDGPDDFSAWWRRKDGSRFWCEARVFAIADGEAGDAAFGMALRDLTATHRAQAARQETETLLLAALRRAPIVVAHQDPALRYTLAPVGILGTGAAAEEVVGHTDEELLAPELAAPLTRAKRDVLDRGQPARFELSVPTPAGPRYFDVALEAVRDARGQVAGVVTAAFDVTERHEIEAELRRSRERLDEAEHVARLGSWEWEIEPNIVHWSAGLFEIYGIAREQFAGRYEPSSERVHPDDRERIDRQVRQALESHAPYEVDYRIVRPDGRIRVVHGRGEVIVDGEGRPIRMVGTAQDVTEVRAAEEALEETAAELGRRAAELQRVARRGKSGTGELERVLSRRQTEVLELVAEGLTNAEIGERLYLSEGTVKWHVRQILKALGGVNRAQAVARYLAARD